MKKNIKAFTYIELMMAIVVLVIGVLSTILVLSKSYEMTVIARDMSAAVAEADYILETVHAGLYPSWYAGVNWNTLPELNPGALGNRTINVSVNYPVAHYVFIGSGPDQASVPYLTSYAEIDSVVSWQTRGRNYSLRLISEDTGVTN